MRPLGWVLDQKDSSGHEISVKPFDKDKVTINWGCSSHLLANPAEVVSNIEKVLGYPDVWLTLRTTVGSARYVRVEGGRLYADQNNPSANAVSCDYEDFKAALLAAANSNQEEGKGMT